MSAFRFNARVYAYIVKRGRLARRRALSPVAMVADALRLPHYDVLSDIVRLEELGLIVGVRANKRRYEWFEPASLPLRASVLLEISSDQRPGYVAQVVAARGAVDVTQAIESSDVQHIIAGLSDDLSRIPWLASNDFAHTVTSRLAAIPV